MTESHSLTLEALVGFSDEWMRRTMESVFQAKGYRVTCSGSGDEALRLARYSAFDVIMLEERIRPLSGVEVCIALRDDPLFDHATPIVIVASAHSTPASRTAAYSVGCWEYCHQPVDLDGLFLKLTTFLRARRELAEHKSRALAAVACPRCTARDAQDETFAVDFAMSNDLQLFEGRQKLAFEPTHNVQEGLAEALEYVDKANATATQNPPTAHRHPMSPHTKQFGGASVGAAAT